MIHRLSIATMLAAVFSVPLGHDVSHAEPIGISLAQAKALPAAETDKSRLTKLLARFSHQVA
ncbi:MAG: hypothetical protein JRS35_10560 [Deltaproteobacteria bacterium]|nr:hypothetical protein [Deltaproteobacteria bacterium]